jgi:heme A synthase
MEVAIRTLFTSRPDMMTLFPDVPLAVVLVHLLALVVLLTHIAVTRLRRSSPPTGRNVPGTFLVSLLHVLLGLPK